MVRIITHIIDFQAIQPRNKTNARQPIPIDHSPKRNSVAQLRVNIPRRDSRDNTVELIATVGVEGVTNIAQIVFRIFRDNTEIFNTQVGIESTDSEQFYAVTFQAIDKDLRSGTHIYTLTVENMTAGAEAAIVGPVSFSALAIGNDHDCC
ncbi:exosporium protein C [Bacillus pseudomycoides]|nr:hypothetical protein bmyco0002_20060 [Bacillus pseudomycoides]EEM08055.1 hypothetical protein bmyco0003_52550 [Bacillus pseudomycoides]PEK29924.1 exosporium protein C [Bacillus pseudomycoides]PEK65968.1 exosporium protein C [Bacillus pseudomycoides]PEP37683.1 exosporium protein C [Bacillus pseudomycoides]